MHTRVPFAQLTHPQLGAEENAHTCVHGSAHFLYSCAVQGTNPGNCATYRVLCHPRSINTIETVPTDMLPGQPDLHSPSLSVSSQVILDWVKLTIKTDRDSDIQAGTFCHKSLSTKTSRNRATLMT